MNRKERRAAGKQGASAGAGANSAARVGGLLAAAVQHHQAGRLRDAEALYREILDLDRHHVPTLRNLGILALQTGRHDLAAEVLNRAVSRNDAQPDCHYNLALALQALGRHDDAAAHYGRAVALKPDYAEAHMNLGNVLNQQGRLAEAASAYRRVVALRPDAPEASYNLANLLAQQGELDEAVTHYRRTLALKPDLAEAHNNLGNALMALGRTDAALEHYRQVLALDPRAVAARVNVANVLAGQGRHAEAAAQLDAALALDPGHAEARNNRGSILMQQGDLEAAAAEFRRAVQDRPAFAEPHNNLGLVAMAQGDLAQAERCFQQALRLRPDFVAAHENAARLLLAAGDPVQALALLRRALAIAETAETKSLIVECLRGLVRVADEPDLRALVRRALTEPWGRPDDVAPAAVGLLQQNAALRRGVEVSGEAAPDIPPADLAMLARDELLRDLLQSARIADAELERALTALRRTILVTASGGAAWNDETLAFACALARQCFANEYAYRHDDEEYATALRLRDAVTSASRAGSAISEPALAALAAYMPLHELEDAASLLAREWSPPVRALLAQQVADVIAEREARAAMPALTPIVDDISVQVRRQYEENPYPRWDSCAPPPSIARFEQYLRGKFPSVPLQGLARQDGIDLLIAGCGTGQHAIETARRFPSARVLAIDLSLASLGYARRKAQAMGVTNLDYAQADILQLASLDRRFDVIETSGVLHHLADPFAGWRSLLKLLRPGGFMMVGLYSELARADLAPVRAFIAERGYGATASDIRRFRQDIMASADPALHAMARIGDFYSLSGCRDLLFHVQEHRLTLPQIKGFLADNDLRLIGFEIDAATRGRYRRRFPTDSTMTDLDSWHAFETENPRSFRNMYQFWVQSPPDREAGS